MSKLSLAGFHVDIQAVTKKIDNRVAGVGLCVIQYVPQMTEDIRDSKLRYVSENTVPEMLP